MFNANCLVPALARALLPYKLFLDLVYAALRLGGCIKHCTHISVRLCRAWQVTKERKDLG